MRRLLMALVMVLEVAFLLVLASGASGCKRSKEEELPASVVEVGPKCQFDALSVDFTFLDATCFHQLKGDLKRSRLHFGLQVINERGSPQTVTVKRCYLSLVRAQIGNEIPGIGLIQVDGDPSAEKAIRIGAHQERSVEYVGLNVLPEDQHDQEIYVTLMLSEGSKSAMVRRTARIKLKM
jgi:hypothetical protein